GPDGGRGHHPRPAGGGGAARRPSRRRSLREPRGDAHYNAARFSMALRGETRPSGSRPSSRRSGPISARTMALVHRSAIVPRARRGRGSPKAPRGWRLQNSSPAARGETEQTGSGSLVLATDLRRPQQPPLGTETAVAVQVSVRLMPVLP